MGSGWKPTVPISPTRSMPRARSAVTPPFGVRLANMAFAWAILFRQYSQGVPPFERPGRLSKGSIQRDRLMKIKTIVTGATGMVGEGVLIECLNHPDVEEILVINRKPGGVSHPKLREIIHGDFFNLVPIEQQLAGFDACFFCLGVSSVGMSNEEYRHITHDLTLNLARLLVRLNPETTFCYVTGAGTDSSEQGRIAWARVKGATEKA